MIDLMTLKPGDRLQLTQKIVAEVTENMGDGMWVEVRLIEAPDRPDEVGAVGFRVPYHEPAKGNACQREHAKRKQAAAAVLKQREKCHANA